MNFKRLGIWLFVLSVFLPLKVFAGELEDIYNTEVKNDTVEFMSIKPTSEEEFDFYTNLTMQKVYDKYEEQYIYVSIGQCNDDYSKCKYQIVYQPEGENLPLDNFEKEVNVVWQDANKNVLAQITKYSENLANIQGKNEWGYNNQYYFNVEDLDLVNYYMNAGTADLTDEVVENTLKYSAKLRELFGGANLTFAIDFRAGSLYSPFETEAFGGLIIKYNGVTYAVHDAVGIKLNEIIYVPSDTELNDEALISAATNRIKEYMPDAKIEITSSTAFGEYKNVDDDLVDFTNIIDVTKTNGKVYKVNFGKFATDFVIVADSSKIKTPEFVTKDLDTNIEISSSSSRIPLDTLIKASKLDSGETYEKLIKLLEVKDNETYDLTLYSTLTGKYITKLDNGSFEVKIPIDEKLLGKDLMVYYVDENDKVIEYKVEVKDGYAIFTTDHFSVYTLAENAVKEDVAEAKTNNPQTAENIFMYLGIFSVSLLGLCTTVKLCKIKNN